MCLLATVGFQHGAMCPQGPEAKLASTWCPRRPSALHSAFGGSPLGGPVRVLLSMPAGSTGLTGCQSHRDMLKYPPPPTHPTLSFCQPPAPREGLGLTITLYVVTF